MDWTRPFIGIPFLPRGRTREGLDCWGLLRLVYRERLGLSLPEFIGYQDVHDQHEIGPLIRSCLGEWHQVEKIKTQCADAILFRIGQEPMHVAVMVSWELMLHVHNGAHSCIESISSPIWRNRLLGFYRHESLIRVGDVANASIVASA